MTSEIPNLQFEILHEQALSTELLKNENPSEEYKMPPDGGWGWVVVVASVFASLLGDGVAFSFGVYTTEFEEHFEVSRSVVGWIGSIMEGMTLCSGLLASVICNAWGYRFSMILGTALAFVGFATPFLYGHMWLVIIMTSFVTGIGFGLIYLPSIVIVNIYFEKRRSLALGIAVCGSGIGTFVFSPLIEVLIYAYGWQGSMLIVSGILLNCIPCGLFYRSLNKRRVNSKEPRSNKGAVNQKTFRVTAKHVLSNNVFILFAISNFLTSFGFNSPYLYVKDRAMVARVSHSKASFLISSIGIGNSIGRLIFGYLASTNLLNRFHIYNGSLIISGSFLIASWGASNYYWMIAYTSLFGLMSGTYVTLTSIVLLDILGMENLNFSFGLINMCQGISVFLGPPLTGAIYDATLSFDVAFTFCGIFLALSGAIMYLAYLSTDFREKVDTLSK